jgi:predicted dehydrogenase
MGRNHARVLADLPHVALVGVADPAEMARAGYVAPRGVMVYADYRQMLEAERPDAVTVSVPTALHCEVTCAALEAGAHVLVEKPIARTLEEADRMIATAQAVGKKLMVGHVERFNPVVTELKRLIGSGELGRIHQMHARRIGPFPQRVQDVGVILDLATHDIDVMHFLTGGSVVRVSAETNAPREDMLAGVLRFDTGAVGVLDVHWLGTDKIRELTVVAEGGTFAADYLTQRLLGGATVARREPLRIEHEQFAECILSDGTPFVSGTEGRATLSVALRLMAAVK